MIEHDESKKKFFLLKDNTESHLLYRFTENGSIDIYSTYVPEGHRGQGIAKKLVDVAVEYAKEKEVKVKPTCSYVKDYFDKQPQLKSLVL